MALGFWVNCFVLHDCLWFLSTIQLIRISYSGTYLCTEHSILSWGVPTTWRCILLSFRRETVSIIRIFSIRGCRYAWVSATMKWLSSIWKRVTWFSIVIFLLNYIFSYCVFARWVSSAGTTSDIITISNSANVVGRELVDSSCCIHAAAWSCKWHSPSDNSCSFDKKCVLRMLELHPLYFVDIISSARPW